MMFVKQKIWNKETKKYTRVMMTYKCSTLENITCQFMEGKAAQQYLISEMIEEKSKLFIARIDNYALNVLDFKNIKNFDKNT